MLALTSMYDQSHATIDARDMRIGIALSRYHSEISQSLHKAAVETFLQAGGNQEHLTIAAVPGSFELTAMCRVLACRKTPADELALDAIVALGCVIRGQTHHDQCIIQSLVQGLTAITVQTGVPIAFGVLTCQNLEQAQARSTMAAGRGSVNKGAEAMQAAIQTVDAIRSIQSTRSRR